MPNNLNRSSKVMCIAHKIFPLLNMGNDYAVDEI